MIATLNTETNAQPDMVMPSRLASKVAVDPGLTPALDRLDLLPPGRLWMLARSLDSVGEGRVKIDDLAAAADELKIAGEKHFRNILKKGEGIFWTRAADWLYLRGYAALWADLTARLVACAGAEIASKITPLRRVLVDISGPLREVKPRFHDAWIAAQQPQDRELLIYRDRMADTWGRSKNTLRRRERAAGVEVVPTVGQYGGDDETMLPHDAEGALRADVHLYRARTEDGQLVENWRLQDANQYMSTAEIHPARGKLRKARKARRAAIMATGDPGLQMGPGKTGRSKFWDRGGKKPVSAFKLAERAYRKHGISRRRWVVLGRHKNRLILELVDPHTGVQLTRLDERDHQAECSPDYQRRDHALKYLRGEGIAGHNLRRKGRAEQDGTPNNGLAASCDPLFSVVALVLGCGPVLALGYRPLATRKRTDYNPAILERQHVAEALGVLQFEHIVNRLSKTALVAYTAWLGANPNRARRVLAYADEGLKLPPKPESLLSRRQRRRLGCNVP